jgi:hypothetical protein
MLLLYSIVFLTLAGSAFSALRRVVDHCRFIQNSADVLENIPSRIAVSSFILENRRDSASGSRSHSLSGMSIMRHSKLLRLELGRVTAVAPCAGRSLLYTPGSQAFSGTPSLINLSTSVAEDTRRLPRLCLAYRVDVAAIIDACAAWHGVSYHRVSMRESHGGYTVPHGNCTKGRRN